MFKMADKFFCPKPITLMRILQLKSAFSLKSCWIFFWQDFVRPVVPIITSHFNGVCGFSKAYFLYYLI